MYIGVQYSSPESNGLPWLGLRSKHDLSPGAYEGHGGGKRTNNATNMNSKHFIFYATLFLKHFSTNIAWETYV